MTRYMPGQPQNHNIWWYAVLPPHSILGLCRWRVYDLWTVCGGGVDGSVAALRGLIQGARTGRPCLVWSRIPVGRD